MTDRPPEPQPTFTLVDLLAGSVVLGVLGWALGGAAGFAPGRGRRAGSRVGGWSGLGLFTALVVRTIRLASHGGPGESGAGPDA